MAEHVQAALDQMVAPLRDLLDRQIFTEVEIKAIVSRRRESEYLLRRMVARKADFLRYIAAEQTLERLRQLRAVQQKRDHRKSRQEWLHEKDDDGDDGDEQDTTKDKDGNRDVKKKEQHIGDVHIVQHVHLLFDRAIRKFRSDLSLHLQHAEWCKQQNSWTRLGRVYAEALQVFPRQAGLWIEAASHEFFGPNRSVHNARVLLQRGIRLNEHTSEELWIEYFSLELHFAQTLRGRRQILLLEPPPSRDNEDQTTATMAAAAEEYKLASIILRNAIRAIPTSVQFRLRFMDTCKRFPTTDFLMEYIQYSMKKDFASEPESWIARALYVAEKERRRCLTPRNDDEPPPKRAKAAIATSGDQEENNDSVVANLQEAIRSLPTEDMFLQAFRFVHEYQNEVLEFTGSSDRSASVIKSIQQFIDDLWKSVGDYTSADLAMEHTQYLLRAGKSQKAIDTIQKYCTTTTNLTSDKPPKQPKVVPAKAWILWTSLSPREKQRGILKLALDSVSMDRPDYMELLLQHFGAQLAAETYNNSDDDDDDDDDVSDSSSSTFKELYDTLQKIILLAPKTTDDIMIVQDTTTEGLDFGLSSIFQAYCAYLDYIVAACNETTMRMCQARKVYTAILFQSTIRLTEENVDDVKAFIDRCLKLEHTSGGDSKRLRRLYDQAVEIFTGTSLEGMYRQYRNDKAVYA
jgi:hypothetical protein